ncbi:MAG TPA: TonB-dependent receptor [Thermoanaerobaculia bacterium]|nr:TonB-dependent receptor [Thermoanaerobaculia bacterium]
MRKLLLLLLLVASSVASAQAQPAPIPPQRETIEVTATKVAEDVLNVPASVTVIDGDELRARNANDLQSALALTSGLSIAPGGDGGPAGSVPEIWGLREFDAFLLVVDGVPWGGAFNPDLPALDLTGVDRIEIVRGSAPVMYGATSFVGVIHVIHRAPGAPALGQVSAGSYGSASVAASIPISQSAKLQQSITANADRARFRDDRTGFDRFHALYRASDAVAGGTFRFDADLTALRQEPSSPHPRVGAALTTDIPIDTNHNPGDAHLDQDRIHLVAGWDTKVAGSPWTTTLALSHSTFNIKRGFIDSDLVDTPPNAFGFFQDRTITDVYFDTHIVRMLSPSLRLVAGFDHLFGNAHAESTTFHYFAPLRGGGKAELLSDADPFESFDARDRRDFSGLYASSQWTATPQLRFDAGARLNRTSERRQTNGPDGPQEESRSFTRISGSAGVDYSLLPHNRDAFVLFADYRNTFKPAAIDFGPEAEVDILDPETASSYEAGAKGRSADGRLRWTASLFQMDFRNLVIAATVDGTPILENAGKERFKGFEAEAEYEWAPSLKTQFGYSYHDARFVDFVKEFDPGVPTQLAGKRLEMSPFHLASAGLLFSPKRGLNAHVSVSYTGSRWLNQRNTALANAYTTWSAGAGYRMGHGELRLDGHNLSNVRPPVSESELGDSQYYLLPARTFDVSYRYHF